MFKEETDQYSNSSRAIFVGGAEVSVSNTAHDKLEQDTTYVNEPRTSDREG